jgi:hypothetical protein
MKSMGKNWREKIGEVEPGFAASPKWHSKHELCHPARGKSLRPIEKAASQMRREKT